jgi:hypothetical protein
MSLVEQKYLEGIDALTPMERVARASTMFQWARETIARQIVAESGPMSSERLKWLVAMRQYGSDPVTRAMIERMLERVPS